MKVLVTGISGFVGQKLGLHLVRSGHEVVGLSRRPERTQELSPFPLECFAWAGDREPVPPQALQGVEAVVHLAGESVAEGRWTARRKQQLRDSRVLSAQNLLSSLQGAQVAPKVFVAASAIGFYGDRGDEELTEASSLGEGFLAELTQQWEEATSQVSEVFPTCRLTQLRIGVVLGEGEGFLGKVVPLFRKGLGGRLGSGRQWMSLIHVEDLVRVIGESLENKDFQGVVNAVGPEPLTNAQMTSQLANHLGAPALFPAPAPALKLALGEMSQMLLSSQRVRPQRLLELGFEFSSPSFFQAVAKELNHIKEGFEQLFTQQWVPRPLPEVFEFYRDEGNLQKITPPWLDFQVLGKNTPEMGEGTRIDYKLKLKGLPIRWQSAIENWDPPRRFSDRQLKGPYRHWFHLHEFEELAGGTLITDRVHYQLPLGLIGRASAGPWVKRDVEKIFKYRRKVIDSIFKV